MASPELLTLVKCREQLIVVMRNNIEAIASFLNLKDIINRQIYREVTNSKFNMMMKEPEHFIVGLKIKLKKMQHIFNILYIFEILQTIF